MSSSEVLFKSFSSGSCGNCYLLAIREEGAMKDAILIDAGVSLRTIRRELSSNGIPLEALKCVLVTHDHLDHIRSLGAYAKRLKLPIWASETLHTALSTHPMTRDYVPSCRKILAEGEWNDIVADKISVRYFVVPHDATQTVGFAIRIAGIKYVHITDCGALTDEAMSFLKEADSIVIESNYDDEMLDRGSYPEDLKRRIRGGNGHLSNAECAQAIKELKHDGLREIFLCHLSENNNTPKLAYRSAVEALGETEGRPPRLESLPRRTPSKLTTL